MSDKFKNRDLATRVSTKNEGIGRGSTFSLYIRAAKIQMQYNMDRGSQLRGQKRELRGDRWAWQKVGRNTNREGCGLVSGDPKSLPPPPSIHHALQKQNACQITDKLQLGVFE